MKQKHLALALSAVFAATALAGCGSDSSDNYQPYPEQPSNPDQPGTDEPGTDEPGTDEPGTDEPGTDEPGTDEPGTDEPGTDEPPVEGDPEDNVGEAATDPQAGVPTVGGQQYVRGETAKFDRELNPADANSGNATVLNSKTLQNEKMDNIVVGRETVERLGVRESLLRYVGKSVDGFSDKTEAETTSLQVTNAANGIDVDSGDFTTNGLVSIDKQATGNAFTVTGQEDTVTGLKAATGTGSTLSTRIFGNKSLDTTNAADKNSARFLGKVNAQGNYDITGLDLTPAENGTANKFETTKLNNVQYGRVTSTIDKLDADDLSANTKYYESVLVDTRNPVKAENGTVDTYFYRGTGETTVAQMDALQAKGGKVEYAGHALMYGIDNAYHGNLGDPDSNSFGGTDKPVAGKGNFVQATVDMGNRTVEGNIFNVWEVTPGEGDNVFKQDKLVNFNGQIFGNTAKGESQLAYGDKDKGAFKGSFYGNQAQEFGGSVNSVDKGYGNAAWGGVFGANQVVAPTITPEDGNANQTE